MVQTRNEVKVSERDMISVKWRKHRHRLYVATETEDGVITLTPAVPENARIARRRPDKPKEDVFSRVVPVDEIKDRVRETALWQERT